MTTYAAADLVPLGDKAKVPACVVLHEVDVHGRPIPTTAVAS